MEPMLCARKRFDNPVQVKNIVSGHWTIPLGNSVVPGKRLIEKCANVMLGHVLQNVINQTGDRHENPGPIGQDAG
jgi:hypothetical protein